MTRELKGTSSDAGHCCDGSDCCAVDRRTFVKVSSVSLAALGVMGAQPAIAGPFSADDTIDHFVPVDKKLKEHWIRQLFARGDRTWYSGEDLDTIGMPVGGICAGQVYLTGDGRLVYWGIFNQQVNSGYGRLNYKVGREPTERVVANREIVQTPDIDQGFAIKVSSQDGTQVRSLDRTGFPGVRFCGEYPIGYVDYVDNEFPVNVELEAFSPFIPLNTEDSTLPATVLNYTVKNASSNPVEVTVAGRLQNAVLHHNRDRCEATHRRVNVSKSGEAISSVLLRTREREQEQAQTRPPTIFADFEGDGYGEWKVEGEAFGEGPAKGTLERQQRVSGYRGEGLINTYLGGSDERQGKLTSPAFTIERPYISFLVGGGSSEGTAIRLIVNGKVVKTASGEQSERLKAHNWNVRELIGSNARLEIVDEESGPWGHINVDQIQFRDTPLIDGIAEVSKLPDFGTLALSVIGSEESLVSTSLPPSAGPTQMFAGEGLASDGVKERSLGEQHRAAVGARVTLQPGEQATMTFVVSWHMPNLYRGDELVLNQYATRFSDAAEVANFVAGNRSRLTNQTRLWHDTYYDSTLPYWLLDRLHSTVANLASETCQWWGNGRFWAYEGCGCCRGTCGHVWNYEHALARLFPPLERSVREMQDFAPGVGFIPETGEIRFRGENWPIWAGDSQGGYLLKAYREHQLSDDNAFLKRNWPNIRKAIQFLISEDGDDDGLLEGRQHQTYDKDFFGPNTMVGSLYLGALRAAEEMAREIGDEDFAHRCAEIFQKGRAHSAEQLFNGEYFIQKVDSEEHPNWQYANGCLADQLFGQGWAHQVNLGYLYPTDMVKKSLESIWKYCWAPDVGLQNEKHEPERWFAYPGEAGLFICTWPKSEHLGPQSTRYRNEVWTGIEYQVANHMAYEGMLTEALAICRAVHDRYHPSKHNPYNEIECGDHYARALASWGVLLGLAGFEYHGPKRHIGFLPRIRPEEFRCVFTAADGWGSYEQVSHEIRQHHELVVKWGQVALASLAFQLPEGKVAKTATVRRAGSEGPKWQIGTRLHQQGRRVKLSLDETVVVHAGETLRVEFEF